jgi:hypothetical protein
MATPTIAHVVLSDQALARFHAQLPKGDPESCWEWKRLGTNGYGIFGLNVNGKYKSIAAHRLSWSVANGPIPDGMYVLHSCDNPPCCNPAHLRIGTQRDNAQDRINRGRCGRRNVGGDGTMTFTPANAKLTRAQVAEMLPRIRAGERLEELARAYGVSRSAVIAIVMGRNWRSVTGGKCGPGMPRGANHPNMRFDKALAEQIMSLRQEGLSCYKIRDSLGLSKNSFVTICKIIKGEHWTTREST